MKILGIETATERLSVALLKDGLPYERHTDARSSHCELISEFISELVAETRIDIDDLDCVAVSLGPGSFTGLRIGIASAMGISYAIGKPACGINSLMGIAASSGFPGTLVCPLIDAKRSEAYTAMYRLGNNIPEQIVAPMAMPVSDLADMLNDQGEQVIITGPGMDQFRPVLEDSGADVQFVASAESKPSAISIARLGGIFHHAGQCKRPSELKPLYLRRSDAELLRDAQCKKS